jgi:hypothetical protein
MIVVTWASVSSRAGFGRRPFSPEPISVTTYLVDGKLLRACPHRCAGDPAVQSCPLVMGGHPRAKDRAARRAR